MKEIKSVSNNEKIYTTKIFGPLLWLMILLLLIILVGMFFWYNTLQQTVEQDPRPARPTAEQNREPESRNAQTDVMILQTLSTSDTLEVLKNDLDNTNLSNLTSELEIIDRELERYLSN